VEPRRVPSGELKTGTSRDLRQKAMHEHLMEAVVAEDNRRRALEAVKRNRSAAGIDHMTTNELEARLQAHWEKIRAKLLGTYVPSPVRRVEISKPSGRPLLCRRTLSAIFSPLSFELLATLFLL